MYAYMKVQLLVKNGLSMDEICVLSCYYAQIQRIRRHLREKRFGKVIVLCIIESVDSISRDGPDAPMYIYAIHYKKP